MIRLELRNDKGQKVVHEQDFVRARKVREALEMMDQFDNGEITGEAKRLDKMVEFVAGVFDDKEVTTDAIYDGIPASQTLKELNRVIDEVMGREKKEETGEK
jgi:hypothetical protein